jgi:citrate synthase
MAADPPKSAPTARAWTTSVSDIENANVFVRGYSLPELIGRLPFSAATYLLVRGRIPTPSQARVVDAVLCSILDYALEKSGTVAARYSVSSNPQVVIGMATSILAIGDYTIAPEKSGIFIAETYARYRESGEDRDLFAAKIVAEMRAAGRRIPGFTHPMFRFVDPRAAALKSVAVKEGAWGEICEWYEAVHRAFMITTRPENVINLVGMIAMVLSELGFTPPEMTGLAVISTLPGVVAHIAEELASNKIIRGLPDDAVAYARSRRDLDADLAAAGWTA